jgi:hypothetical protein
MYLVVRRYEKASPLFDLLLQREEEVKQVISGVQGLVAYYFATTNDGGLTVTVCETEEGTRETTRLAAEWVNKNAPGLSSGPPEVHEGDVIFSF